MERRRGEKRRRLQTGQACTVGQEVSVRVPLFALCGCVRCALSFPPFSILLSRFPLSLPSVQCFRCCPRLSLPLQPCSPAGPFPLCCRALGTRSVRSREGVASYREQRQHRHSSEREEDKASLLTDTSIALASDATTGTSRTAQQWIVCCLTDALVRRKWSSSVHGKPVHERRSSSRSCGPLLAAAVCPVAPSAVLPSSPVCAPSSACLEASAWCAQWDSRSGRGLEEPADRRRRAVHSNGGAQQETRGR